MEKLIDTVRWNRDIINLTWLKVLKNVRSDFFYVECEDDKN